MGNPEPRIFDIQNLTYLREGRRQEVKAFEQEVREQQQDDREAYQDQREAHQNQREAQQDSRHKKIERYIRVAMICLCSPGI